MKEATYCPRCGRLETGNTHQDDLVMCGYCVMLKVGVTSPEAKAKSGDPLPTKPRKGSRVGVCKGCQSQFPKRSNRQEFCSACQDRNRKKNDRSRAKSYRDRHHGLGTANYE